MKSDIVKSLKGGSQTILKYLEELDAQFSTWKSNEGMKISKI
ncbi:hypothetical protein [Candidatus Lokiarchaeum ossiferum]